MSLPIAAQASLFEEPHHESLELAAVRSLAQGNFKFAYQLADRRCRISPPPESHCYVLRADALYGCGERAAAVVDISTALKIAPEDLAANRRMLTWGDPEQQLEAATTLVGCECDFAVLRKAIQILSIAGQARIGHIAVFDEAIEGWAVWDTSTPLAVSINSGGKSDTFLFDADAFHPLASNQRYAIDFKMPRPQTASAQQISLAINKTIFFSFRAPANYLAAGLPQSGKVAGEPDAGVTVIVPVYGDFDATKACLDSLLPQLGKQAHSAILVNDATPDARIAEYLERISKNPRVRLLSNKLNMGFSGSVNRALTYVKSGDIVLLNADTILPEGCIDRLAAIARSASDIGTVTPLSNNGEFTSFPVAHTANPLEPLGLLALIDKTAAEVNAGVVVDIPSGIGFCMYVTRACLDAVKSLSEVYQRGYFEDIDFCLRAQKLGFRSVCSPAVYVGHAGTRSFRKEKQTLVVRNLKILRHRFPGHEHECAAYLLMDPLRASREAIERALPPRGDHPRLLVAGRGAVGALAHDRAKMLASRGCPSLVLAVDRNGEGNNAHISDPVGLSPQSVRFRVAADGESDGLHDYLDRLQLSKIEICDPANVSPVLLQLLLTLNVPFDLFVADAGLLCPPETSFSFDILNDRRHEARLAAPPTKNPKIVRQLADWKRCWEPIVDRAEQILVPSEQAMAFASAFLPKNKIRPIESQYRRFVRARIRSRKGKIRGVRLGLLPIRSSAQEQMLMSKVIAQITTLRPEAVTTVFGQTLDDRLLMQASSAFVTGPVAADELKDLISFHGVNVVFVLCLQPLFGHPLEAAALASGYPLAYFDWSSGQVRPRKGDRALNPYAAPETVAAAVADWTAQP